MKKVLSIASIALSVTICGALSFSSQYFAPPALGAEVTASSSEGVALTIYNQNFGLVKDVRKVQLNAGINYLRFSDVAAAIDPTSVNFMSLTAPNTVVVREQNYQYDVMDPDTILSKSVGKQVTFRQFVPGGGERQVTGTLLNPPRVSISDVNGNVSERTVGMVVKTDSGIVLRPQGQAELLELPPGLVSKPSLLWKLEASKAGEHRSEISYQTAGLNWRCDYVAVINEDDTRGDITSWVTLDNKSGTGYKNASLKLLAGDVHRVQEQARRPMLQKAARLGGAFAAPQFTEKSFAEYHLYSLAHPTDVNNNETKQLTLFNAANVPTVKRFIFEPEPATGWHRSGSNPQKVNVKIEIANTEKNNMGMALPKGKVRVYKRDTDGSLQFIGEDMIDHTPRDEKVRLYIGDAFDVVGEKKQLSYERPNQHMERKSIEISLRNHKDKAVTVTAVEHAWGDWKVTDTSHQFVKKDAKTFEYTVEVPARGEVKITYTIQARF